MYTKESELTIKPMAMASIHITPVSGMRALGLMISSMDLVLRLGLMELGMRASILKGKSMGRGKLTSMMVHSIKESSEIMKFVGLDNISGMMGKFIKGFERRIK
jgi:hypothetical protein